MHLGAVTGFLPELQLVFKSDKEEKKKKILKSFTGQ